MVHPLEALLADKSVRAVFFDAVGTVIHPQPPAAEVYAAVGARCGSRLGVAEIAARFRVAFQHEESFDQSQRWRTDEARERQRWCRIVATVLDDVQAPEECFNTLYRHFAQAESWRVDAKVLLLVQRLAATGWTVGVASNFDERLRSVVAGFAEMRCIQHLVISAEVGWRKPAAEFFAAVCRAAELPPEQILFIGDDPVNDLQGASAAGMKALLVQELGT